MTALDHRAALAQDDARHTARGLGNLIVAATLCLGLALSWCAYGWTWAAGYVALWVGCVAVVRRLPKP